MCRCRDGIMRANGRQEVNHIFAVNRLIITDYGVSHILDVQGSHDIQPRSAPGGLYRFILAFSYPAVAYFGGLCRMNGINKQYGVITRGVFQFAVGLYKLLLFLNGKFMRNTFRLFIAKAMLLQPFIQT